VSTLDKFPRNALESFNPFFWKGRSTVLERCTTAIVLLAVSLPLSRQLNAQAVAPGEPGETRPSAPNPQQTDPAARSAAAGHQLNVDVTFPRQIEAPASGSKPASSDPNTGGVMHLTRSQAEQLAIKNNPRISVVRLLALAQNQMYRETRAAELPTFDGLITAVQAKEASRISAGDLNAPRVLVHAGAGIALNQLITDFGRTINLVSSAKLREKAQSANALATTEDIVLAVDRAFYNALQAEALLKVAQQTVATRQSVADQVNELTKNELRSDLDLTFAQVNLSQAKLLQLDAQNNLDATLTTLTAVLGFDKQMQYELVAETTEATVPPSDSDALTNLALKQRPDLRAVSYDQEASQKFRRAQRDLLLPSIKAIGVGGGAGSPRLYRRMHDLFQLELVWRSRRERQHSDLQWISLQC
jgi:outer membrane protein TolC